MTPQSTSPEEGRALPLACSHDDLMVLSRSIPPDLIRYVGIGYKVFDPVDAIKPTPQSWDWAGMELWNEMPKEARRAYMAVHRHRVSSRTVIHERLAMWSQRDRARGGQP